ncbi:hypothetical protein F0Q45_26755, partial [Mycobacterium simiae]
MRARLHPRRSRPAPPAYTARSSGTDPARAPAGTTAAGQRPDAGAYCTPESGVGGMTPADLVAALGA